MSIQNKLKLNNFLCRLSKRIEKRKEGAYLRIVIIVLNGLLFLLSSCTQILSTPNENDVSMLSTPTLSSVFLDTEIIETETPIEPEENAEKEEIAPTLTPTLIPEPPAYCLLPNISASDLLSKVEIISPNQTQELNSNLYQGTNQEDYNLFVVVFPRAENGHGNGTFTYANPNLSLENNYALVEVWDKDGQTKPHPSSRIFVSTFNNEGNLEFTLENYGNYGYFFLYKVLTPEEVKECNLFPDFEIKEENTFFVDGLLYIPLDVKIFNDIIKLSTKSGQLRGSSGGNGDNPQPLPIPPPVLHLSGE